MPPRVDYSLHSSLGYRLSLAARLQERRLDDGLKPLGLTRVTWCVLLALGPGGCRKPSEIARFIGIDRTATSRALRQLEAAGLISRSSGDGDRRTTVVALTEAGHETLAQGVPIAQGNARALKYKLTADEWQQMSDLLARLIEGESQDLPRF
ncbi:MarR family transcriptional regulator [Rhodobacteraceae bacterium CCMM004]|nr:MarR family transcriptional regulator [Rhodobacteraceae bacterium CCMM004]